VLFRQSISPAGSLRRIDIPGLEVLSFQGVGCIEGCLACVLIVQVGTVKAEIDESGWPLFVR